jgi:hypothetical protein
MAGASAHAATSVSAMGCVPSASASIARNWTWKRWSGRAAPASTLGSGGPPQVPNVRLAAGAPDVHSSADPKRSSSGEGMTTAALPDKPQQRSLKFKQHPEYRDEVYAHSGGLTVARIMYAPSTSGDKDKPWTWRLADIHAGPDVLEIAGTAASLEDGKKAVYENFKKWLAWAEL